MKYLIIFFVFPLWASTEAFRIEYLDRSLKVVAPDVSKNQYAVIVENRSLSDLVAKFKTGEKDLKFLSVKSGQTKAVEFNGDGKNIVYFIPLSPAFQNVPLEFGKKSYEIPRKR